MSQHGRCRLTWFEDGAARQTDARARITCPPVKLASTAIELPRFNPPSIAAFTCLSSKLPFCASTSPGPLFSWTIKTSEQPAPRVEMDLDAGDSPWGGKPGSQSLLRPPFNLDGSILIKSLQMCPPSRVKITSPPSPLTLKKMVCLTVRPYPLLFKTPPHQPQVRHPQHQPRPHRKVH